MFITALFIIAPNLRQPKCPLTGEWISIRAYLCHEILHRNNTGILTHITTWHTCFEGWTSKTICHAKDSIHKWIYAVWLHSYEVWEQAKLICSDINKNKALLSEMRGAIDLKMACDNFLGRRKCSKYWFGWSFHRYVHIKINRAIYLRLVHSILFYSRKMAGCYWSICLCLLLPYPFLSGFPLLHRPL